MKREKTELGLFEMQVLAYVQLRKLDIIRTGDISPVLGITPKQEWELLSRMARSGLIIRLKRGVYLVPPRMPAGGRWAVSEYFILSKLMMLLQGKYQISGPNAFNFYGYDDQIPNRVYVYNNRIFGDKNIGGVEFVFIKTLDRRLGSIRKFKTSDGIEAVMASRARALMDAIYDWSRYNTIPRGYGWIASSVANESGFAEELISVTVKFGNIGTARRIGYLLALCGVGDNQLAKLKRKLGSSKSLIPWIPRKKAKGSVNRDWGLIINGTFRA
ncbi:MAG: type IV toxin-antitoxin system AbiEi family antitoxin domain-containing protein [Candidatus Heimdallarchaeota archaeon]